MIIGCKLYRTLQCADSMAWAKENIATAPDGSVFLADKLIQARGRSGRVWKIYDGQLNITLLLKPKILSSFSQDDLPIRINQLNMAISLGIHEVLKDFGVGIKWPNDFVISGTPIPSSERPEAFLASVNKKVGGILFHLVWEDGLPVGVVCGFGINVNSQIEQTDELFDIATSLANVSGCNIEMRPLYKNLLISINNYYTKWLEGNFDEIYKLWRQAQVALGKSITIHQKDGSVITGTMMQVLPNGDMLLINIANVSVSDACVSGSDKSGSDKSGSDKSGTSKLVKQKLVSFYMVEQIHIL